MNPVLLIPRQYGIFLKKIEMIKKIVLASIASALIFQSNAQNSLLIPDTLSGTSFDLTMHQDSVQFLPGTITQTFAFNQNKYLGPTLIMNKGDNVNISVTNNLGDTSTLHWHGFHVPPSMDGGPHTMIMDGDTWHPHFTVMNNAATYWYHPHFHGKTALQVMKGAAGLIIIRDPLEAALDLPRKYGVDDFPVIVQSQQLDTDNQFDSRGMEDSILLVNGTIDPFVEMPAQVVRMRILNGAGERTFNFGFTNNKQFYVIGTDGGLLSAPVQTTRIRLSPGERAEILVDLSGMETQTLHLMSYASEIPMGVQGGPTMPMPPGSPPMNSPLNGIDFDILQINVIASTANPVTTIPTALIPVVPIPESTADISRQINFTADSAMVMDGPFYFNDSTFDMMRIDYNIPLNNTEIWSLTNQTMVAHPFHIHDVQFQILDRDGNPPPPVERGWKDLVLVSPNETVRFIAKFEDFTSDSIPYMYHCHILMHEDDGMMGQFLVTDPTSIESLNNKEFGLTIFPNPARGNIQLKYTNLNIQNIQLINLAGKVIRTFPSESKTLDVSSVMAGIYFLNIKAKEGKIVEKVVVK